MIRDNIERILSQIEAVCRRIGRDPSEITFVAITKFASVEEIKEAIAAGITHIGENKVQQARDKFPAFDEFDTKVTKHMVGHLQTNKVKQALELFDCIQSVDSFKLAQEIEKQAAKINKEIDALIQVNVAGEEQKFGIAPSEAFALIEQMIEFNHVHVKGLMTIAPFVDDQDIVRKCFRDLRHLRNDINERFKDNRRLEMKFLSMGMTADFNIAIEEGANMVRIGRAIFSDS